MVVPLLHSALNPMIQILQIQNKNVFAAQIHKDKTQRYYVKENTHTLSDCINLIAEANLITSDLDATILYGPKFFKNLLKLWD